MIRLAVFDVDGTLITKGERCVQQDSVNALHKLREQGIAIAIASGRPPYALEKALLKQITFDYYICSNGAFVRTHDNKMLYQYSFDKDTTMQLIEAFRKSDNALMFQCMDAAHCYHGYKRIANMLNSFLGRVDILVDERNRSDFHSTQMPLAAVAKIEHTDIQAMQTRFSQLLFTPFDECFYDINGAYDKASGIAQVCAAKGWTMENVICFGDDFNDLPMIQQCGIGVAMGNARDEVKQCADYVTAPCNEAGIVQALRQYGLLV